MRIGPIDGSQDVDFKGDEECLRSGDTSVVKIEAGIVDDTHVNGCSDLQQLNDDGKGISSIHAESSKSQNPLEHGLLNILSEVVDDNHGHVKLTKTISKAASDEMGKLGTIEAEESKPSFEGANPDFPSRRTVDQKESRVRLRSSSPVAESQELSKKPAIICEFFAKGWCIKGSSCRFLHERERVDNATQLGDTLLDENELHCAESYLRAKSEFHPTKGFGAGVGGSSVGKDIQVEHGKSLKLPKYEDEDKVALLERTISSSLVSVDSQKSSSRKDGSRIISNSKEAEIFKENHSNHESPISQNIFPKCGSSMRDFGVASGSDSIVRLVEESIAMRRRYLLDFQSSVPSYHFSSRKSTSLPQNSPLLSGSDPTTFSGTSYAQDQLIPSKYKTTFTPYNWEPSVPFRSSYFIPPANRSSDVQYDPFRDSIEQPDVERASTASLKHSSYGHTQDVKSISRRNPLELHKGLQIDSWDKNYNVHDNVIPEAEVESAATSASDAQNKMVEEENPMVPGSVKDILKASRSITDGNLKLNNDLMKHGEMKIENGRQPNELGDEESRVIKYFRASLIEFVKELMKPIWHEGRLSKDVYKVIVQKAEDKILSTLQPNQVPNSSESIKQYLSLSRPKIIKLIQAYVDKYGKF
ncbi:Protein FRIGIDA-ESSENTIAL 1 [Bienertia sinuspersici]